MESLPEAIGAQLAEELREQVNHLSAALQLLTPVVQEQGEQRYGQYLAIANQSIYRLIRTINHLEDIRLPREGSGWDGTAGPGWPVQSDGKAGLQPCRAGPA